MMVPADILSVAPAIAGGAVAPTFEPKLRQAVGRLVDSGPDAALTCLDAVLVGPHVKSALKWMESVGALGVWLPEVQALVDFHTSSPVHHKDLWDR